MTDSDLKIAYFGGEPLGAPVLEELKASDLLPSLIVCNPDRKAGRGQQLTPPPVKTWALEHGIDVWQPTNLKDQAAITEKLADFDLFVVVAYNKILPEWLIELPKHKTLNVHPSLLPLYRGPSPIRTAILEDNRDAIGVSVMLMDKEMDHGALLAQQAMPIADEYWPISGTELDTALANLGGALLAATIPEWITGDIDPQEQDHELATYTQKLTKADGELTLDPHQLPTGATAYELFLKIQAYVGWPGTYFFHNDSRVNIKEAELVDDQLRLRTVVPAGKKPTDFADWLQR